MSVLDKPVDPTLYKSTEVQRRAARNQINETILSLPIAKLPNLPRKKVESRVKRYLPVLPEVRSTMQRVQRRARLQGVYAQLPEIPEDLKPDCKNCKTSACCSSFIVSITKEEYESGIFGEVAVKITRESINQLDSTALTRLALIQMGGEIFNKDKDIFYFLEGSIGEPCPLLTEEGCSVYEDRPVVCRTYTCAVDDRITQGMRDGTEEVRRPYDYIGEPESK